MLPVKRFVDIIAAENLFTQNDRILAAVSGGRDSVLLVHLLKQAGYDFGIAHCNFQLRPGEADAEQEFTKNLAKMLDVPFYTVNFDTQIYAGQHGISTQMAARRLRYDWFEQTRNSFNYTHIAVAHHQNDSVETILLNLTRGTGIAGMHGILPKNGLIVRPLLFLTRDDIDGIVAENNLQYMDDSSNASSKYARNKLRNEVIPRLKELNPKLEDTFNNNMERFRELELLLQNRVAELKAQLMVTHGDEVHMPVAAIKTLQPQKLLLYGLLSPYGFSETAVSDIIASLHKHPGRMFEAPGYVLVLDRTKLILAKHNLQTAVNVSINKDDHEVTYCGYKLNMLHDNSPLIIKGNPMALSVDADKLVYPLKLRGWQQADYFFPLGMSGRKKVSDYFVGEKIPVNQKLQVPLLVNGNGDIIWIGGYRPDERYKVTAHTKKVVIFELYKLNL